MNNITGTTTPFSFQDIYFKVRMQDDRKDNIIAFYNHVFIPVMKNYVIRLIPRNGREELPPKASIKALAPNSPLRENLPPPTLSYTTIYTKRAFTPNITRTNAFTPRGNSMLAVQMMTPRTRILYNFGESQTSELAKANTLI